MTQSKEKEEINSKGRGAQGLGASLAPPFILGTHSPRSRAGTGHPESLSVVLSHVASQGDNQDLPPLQERRVSEISFCMHAKL